MKLKEFKFKNEYIQSLLTLQHEVESCIATCRAKDVIEPASINIPDNFRNNVIKTKICIKVDLSEKKYGDDTLLPIKLATVYSSPVKHKKIMGSRCISPPLVPSIPELRKLLCKKYLESGSNKQSFVERNSVMEIGKLLTKYYENVDTVMLKNNVYFYPCKGTSSNESVQCKYFSIRERALNRNVFCTGCYPYIERQQYKKERLVESPTRKRPFNSLSYK